MARKRLTPRRRRRRRRAWHARLASWAYRTYQRQHQRYRRWQQRRLFDWWRREAARFQAERDARAARVPPPSPAVAAFLAGQSMRSVAYLTPDPGVRDPHGDFPGAVHDAHDVTRDYVSDLIRLLEEPPEGEPR